MNNNENDKQRHLELSSKFLEMGQALMLEGQETNDYAISQSGSFMILLGGLILNEDDTYEFGQLCSMFSAKRILDGLEENNSDITSFLRKDIENESYDDYIKKIKKIRDEDNENDEKD